MAVNLKDVQASRDVRPKPAGPSVVHTLRSARLKNAKRFYTPTGLAVGLVGYEDFQVAFEPVNLYAPGCNRHLVVIEYEGLQEDPGAMCAFRLIYLNKEDQACGLQSAPLGADQKYRFGFAVEPGQWGESGLVVLTLDVFLITKNPVLLRGVWIESSIVPEPERSKSVETTVEQEE